MQSTDLPVQKAGTVRLLGIYIHIPFCIRKCAYCDFLSAPAEERVREAYLNALCEEIRNKGELLSGNRENAPYLVNTVFFGGGTPTCLSARQLLRILDTVRESFQLLPGAEISLECNPKTADQQKLQRLREGGFNRISIGVQAFDDRLLEKLGRIHTAEEAADTCIAAEKAGFTNRNLDLMCGLPGQTVTDLAASLTKALQLSPTHLSVYSLILEEGTPFYQNYRDGAGLPDEDTCAAMDELVHRVMERAGYERYEISNYAKPCFECVHNIKYWDGAEYLGLGLGASSYMRADCGLYEKRELPADCRMLRTVNLSGLKDFCSADRAVGGYESFEPLSSSRETEEYMFMGLRKANGICVSGFEERFGRSFASVYGKIADRYLDLGLMRWEYDRLYLTERGMEISNQILADFLLE